MIQKTLPAMMSVADVARALSVSPDVVRLWIKKGLLPAVKLGGPLGDYRIRTDDVLAKINGN